MIRHNLCKQKFQSMCNSRMDVYFAKHHLPLSIFNSSIDLPDVISFSRISKTPQSSNLTKFLPQILNIHP